MWQIAIGCRTADQRDVGRPFKNFLAFLLSHTAQDAELLSLGGEFFEISQTMKDFLLGLVADGAGVIEDQFGRFHRLHLLITLGHERSDDLFRVMDVHLAAEGFNVKSFIRAHCHIGRV